MFIRFLLCCLLGGVSVTAGGEPADDSLVLKALSRQLSELRTKVQELEKVIEKLESPAPASEPPSTPASSVSPDPSEQAKAGTPSGPQFQFRGFGDLGYSHSNATTRSESGFGLGQMDLFVTSSLSKHFGVLIETVLEADGDGIAVDVERFLFQYRQSRYLNVDVGRYHSAIGYYNTAYHHGKWFETAATRPRLFEFEDEGGLLPIHNVGLYFHGAIPSRSLNLHYVVEVGNGRDYENKGVQISRDVTPGKSLNVAIQARPRRAVGLELGVSLYHDRLIFNQRPLVQQILAAYAVYNRGRLEAMTEFVGMRHTQTSQAGIRLRTHVPGFYSQWSYRVAGPWRPYFRFEFSNPSSRDPIIQMLNAGELVRSGYVGGVRYDLAEFAALKFEVQRIQHRNRPGENRAAINFAFTF